MAPLTTPRMEVDPARMDFVAGIAEAVKHKAIAMLRQGTGPEHVELRRVLKPKLAEFGDAIRGLNITSGELTLVLLTVFAALVREGALGDLSLDGMIGGDASECDHSDRPEA